MSDPIVLTGLDGSNPLAFLAALGAFRVLTQCCPDRKTSWLQDDPKMSWSVQAGRWSPSVVLSGPVDEAEFTKFLFDNLEKGIRAHPIGFMEQLDGAASTTTIRQMFREHSEKAQPTCWRDLDWLSAMCSDLAPEATSQLQTARRDYFFGNMESVMKLTQAEHLRKSLFEPWDYGDPLENQSLHLEPSEDRRHAHQWYKPSGDPTRKKRGGMLGANRLAIEAFPLFQSIACGQKLSTRGFSGNRADDTRWTWPIWSCPINLDTVASLLGLKTLQTESPDALELNAKGVSIVFRSNRILVRKTPNFTPAQPV